MLNFGFMLQMCTQWPTHKLNERTKKTITKINFK